MELGILSLESSFTTPFCEFTYLLELQVSNSSCTFNYFYMKGVGLVGIKENNRIHTHIQGEKKAGYQVYRTYGCKDLQYDMTIRKCTYREVYEFIHSNFKLPKRKITNGSIRLEAEIDENGKFKMRTKIENTDPKYQAQELEAIRVLNSMPHFIPAKFYEKASSGTFILPLEFRKRKIRSTEWHLNNLFPKGNTN
ncbi:hypothetical protein SAMN05421640_2367 [Ekhidna lutea]|uniref:TonB protein C-terminal n=1 Tax=Ekhidna lutea TaxID=447679 RepID=A0A239K2R1_EKHLU|nr:hypothetical protein [Ekhidna lutea]SNT12019.1 hypothetical protein SAMN05421640_2367 [Ekhidna lutea]